MNIRRLTHHDIADAQALFRDLGYDIPTDELTVRLSDVLSRDDHAAFMARDRHGAPLGLVHLYIRSELEKPIEAYIQSLVVNAAARRQGVASALMRTAEDWARNQDLPSVALHTQTHRADALSFYTALGFEEVAQSRMLRKAL